MVSPLVVVVFLGGDAGRGLLAELDVDAEGGQVPVAGLGLELGGTDEQPGTMMFDRDITLAMAEIRYERR